MALPQHSMLIHRVKRILLVCSCFFIAATAQGANVKHNSESPKNNAFEDVTQLKRAVEQHVLSHLASEAIGELSATASNLDPRLKLPSCSQGKKFRLNSHQLRSAQTSVRVSCHGEQPWSIFVPVRLQAFELITVAKEDIARGEHLTDAHITLQKKNIMGAGFGYITLLDAAAGQVATRNIKAGQVIRSNYLAAPIVVKRGDRVNVKAGRGALAVSAPGVAMSKGRIGDQIRVKNTASQRIIDVQITAPGEAIASL